MIATAEERLLQAAPAILGLTVSVDHAKSQTQMGQIELHPEWPLLSRLPMRITAEIQLQRFKVKDLLALRIGSVVESKSTSTMDVPLHCGDVQLGWAEFEVMEQRLAMRITRIA